jgi:hypothetical protein
MCKEFLSENHDHNESQTGMKEQLLDRNGKENIAYLYLKYLRKTSKTLEQNEYNQI